MKNKNLDAMAGKTDERDKGDWRSRYSGTPAIKKQVFEAVYIFLLVVIGFVALILNFNGCFQKWFNISEDNGVYFSRIITCSLCGLLGGAIFDMKWFYKSVAHGFWNEDRKYWRIFTPVISLSVAFCLACIFKDNIIVYGDGFSAATMGFLSGYFSDEAVGKMSEVAKVLFNTNIKDTERNKTLDKSDEGKNNE